MKKIIICGMFLSLMVSTALAKPFLISDSYGPCGTAGLSACPVSAEIFADGVSIAMDVPLESDLSIKYDMVEMPTEEHVYTAIYKDSLGRVSIASNPYLLLKVVAPPTNLRVIVGP